MPMVLDRRRKRTNLDNNMSKSMWAAAIVVVVIGVAFYFFWSTTHVIFNPETIALTSASVTNDHIHITGTSASSAFGFTGYDVAYENKALYFTIHGSMYDTPLSRIKPFEISVPNTYGTISKIYITGDSSGADKLVWENGKLITPVGGHS